MFSFTTHAADRFLFSTFLFFKPPSSFLVMFSNVETKAHPKFSSGSLVLYSTLQSFCFNGYCMQPLLFLPLFNSIKNEQLRSIQVKELIGCKKCSNWPLIRNVFYCGNSNSPIILNCLFSSFHDKNAKTCCLKTLNLVLISILHVTCKKNNTSNDLIPSIETLFAAHTASGFKTGVHLPMRQVC